jgi:dipeptidyl aminopeptidase/acylaminoacyl peptidase
VCRGLVVAIAFMLVFGADAGGRTGEQAAQPRTLAEVRGRVDALAQNGRRIAWIKTYAGCGKQVQILTLPGRRPVYVGSRRGGGCARDYGGPVGAIALGADGRVLWQVSSEGNTYITIGLFTAALRDTRTRPVAGSYFGKDESNPDYLDPSPLRMAADGKAILFYTSCDGSELCVGSRRRLPGIYRLAGRGSRRLAKVTSPLGLAVSGRRFAVVTNSPRCCSSTPAWSHDGSRLAWIYHGNLWTVRADGTGDRQLAAGASPPHWSPDNARRPSWSPDDARLVFERARAQGRRDVYRVDASGGGLRRLASGMAPAWSPDGTKIAFVRGKHVFAIRPDGTGATRLTATARATAGPLSWSPDSRRIAVSRGGDIYSVRTDGGGETRVTTSRRSETEPTWSPDGTRIVYVDGSIAVVNADGSGATRLTGASDRSPAWSPDSKRIALVRMESSQGALWVMNADGSGQRGLIPEERYPDSPQWAPGGSTIVVGDWHNPESSSWPRRPGGIKLVSAIDGKARKIAPIPRSPVEIRHALTGRLVKRFTIGGHARAAALGPDYVALLVNHDPGLRVELYNLNGRLRKAAAVSSRVLNLSAAGRTVVFARGLVIHRMDARTGAVTTLATARWSPVGLTIEGRRVVWAENGRGTARIRAVTIE